MDDIVGKFMQFRNQIKLYHWKTHSFARHKTTDKFLSLFEGHIDRFVETMMGAKDKRVYDSFTIKFEALDDDKVIGSIKNFRDFLQKDLPKKVSKSDTDLLNIRDEILADVNRMLYLFTLE